MTATVNYSRQDAAMAGPNSMDGSSGGAPEARARGLRPSSPRWSAELASGRFALGVASLLGAAMLVLLSVNTSLAAGSIRLSELESSIARVTERAQALDAAVESVSAPSALQQAAITLGMVPMGAPSFLDPGDGSLSGALAPAPASPRRRIAVPQSHPPAGGAGPAPSASRAAPFGQAPAAPAVADPGADGAALPPREAAPTPAPTPVAALPPPAGDGAALVVGGGD